MTFPPPSNVAVGRAFCNEVRLVLGTELGIHLSEELAIGIGEPPKPHRFDLGNRDANIAVECKAFTWTKGGNMPSAKITTAREAVLFLQWLPADWTRILAMSRSTRPTHQESLAQYFVRLNRHLLGDVSVVEVGTGRVSLLHGSL